MTYVNVVITGNVSRKLGRLQRVLSPASIGAFLTTSAEQYLHNRAAQRFAHEGDDAVGQWQQLAFATQNIRSSQGFGAAHPINVRTGRLRDFIVNAPGSLQIDPTGAMLTLPGSQPSGELGEKFQTAQQGKPPRTPARPVLAMSATDLAGVMSLLEVFIRSGVGYGD